MSLDLRRRLMATKPTDIIIDARKGGVSGDAANDKALMEIIYAQGWSKNPEYMTKREAKDVSYVREVFRGNTSITDFTAFKYFGVTKINAYDFFDCTNLKKIGISDSVLDINDYTFNSGCLNLQYIDVDNDNTYYESLSGILYNKGKYEMICIPKKLSGKIIIPETITSLRARLFVGCVFESIEIPDSVTFIGENCFQNCKQLKSVKLGIGLTSMENYVFDKCPSLIMSDLNLPNCTICKSYWGGRNSGEIVTYKSNCRVYLPAVTSFGTYALGGYGSTFNIKYLYIGEDCTKITYPLCYGSTLNAMICMAKTPPAITKAGTVKSKHLYVPASAVEAYQNDQYWSAAHTEITAIENIDPSLLAFMKFESETMP